MPTLTQENWHSHLLTPLKALNHRRDITTFNDWARADSPTRLPFLKVSWWEDGTCCVHEKFKCSVCRLHFGIKKSSNTSSATPPSSSSRRDRGIWAPFMRRWIHKTAAERPRGTRALTSRKTEVQTYTSSSNGGLPNIRSDESYVFPVSSIRILLVNEVKDQRGYLRIPDITVQDLEKRLLKSEQSLWLRYWVKGRAAKERQLKRASGRVLKELERGVRGEKLGAEVERCLSIREEPRD